MRVEELILWYSGLGDNDMRALCAGLGAGAAPHLQKLDLGCNDISADGGLALGAALDRGALPNLKVLHLGGNRLTTQGLAAMAPGLRRRPLELLSLFKHDARLKGAAGRRRPSCWTAASHLVSRTRSRKAWG